VGPLLPGTFAGTQVRVALLVIERQPG